MTNDEAIVKKKYLDAECKKYASDFTYTVWETPHFSSKFLGRGITEQEAWANAASIINSKNEKG